jgi:hypothetical protein
MGRMLKQINGQGIIVHVHVHSSLTTPLDNFLCVYFRDRFIIELIRSHQRKLVLLQAVDDVDRIAGDDSSGMSTSTCSGYHYDSECHLLPGWSYLVTPAARYPLTHSSDLTRNPDTCNMTYKPDYHSPDLIMNDKFIIECQEKRGICSDEISDSA